MIKTDFLPIDYSYFDYEGKNYIKIIGRNNSGKRICLIDTCPVYLWAIVKDEVKKSEVDLLIEKISKINLDIKGRKTKVEKVELHKKKFLGQPVNALKIFATNYKDLHDIADELGFPEIKYRRGYDLGFVTHYIIESKILPLQWYEIEGEILQNSLEFGGIDSTLDVDMCIKVSSVKKIKEKNFIPKVLAFDIETEEFQIGKGKILMISLVSKNFKKVITIKKPKRNINLDFVEYVKDEISLIKKFVEYTKKISPDFLVGYFSDGFDMAYIKARADINKIKLPLGLDNSQPIFYKGAVITCRINGIVHIDLLKFIDSAYSQYMQSETLSLNDVSWEFLNERKKDFEFKSLRNMSDNDWKNYFEYNLQDSDLTYKLFLKLWPDIMAFSKVIQEPVFEISRNGMSKNVESFILHNLERFNEIPERRPTNDEVKERMRLEKYEGAFVFQPTPGLYENIAVFDFTSSYGSTIVTYNLSKSTYIENPNKIKSEKEVYSIEVLGKKVYFTKKPGFFPEMLKEIILLRKKYKQELKSKEDALTAARSNAFKLLANASYGYQGFFGARYYCREAAAATAAFARKAIQNSIKAINEEGYTVIYSDTDSIAFLLNNKTEKETIDFLRKLNEKLPGIMELELEGFFKRGIWVTKRTGGIGAKKKYALIENSGRLKIRGFETVRRDWCKLARETQNRILRMILEEGNEKKALEYVREIIKRIKERKVERRDLLIRTQLRKSLSEYKAISPHVIAAQKMQEQKIPIDEGALIEYFIAETREKKKLIREKVKLANEKGEYDIEYYLEHQILPAIENIFQVFNVDVNELIRDKKQKKLLDFSKE